VLTSPDVVARAAAVIPSDASDHLPVVADLILPR
jgi:endonuclease/exonuclease/phosphatase family metal-dependent hydrolase